MLKRLPKARSAERSHGRLERLRPRSTGGELREDHVNDVWAQSSLVKLLQSHSKATGQVDL
jgi:hypothetical protein